jgi:hypothetical protein
LLSRPGKCTKRRSQDSWVTATSVLPEYRIVECWQEGPRMCVCWWFRCLCRSVSAAQIRETWTCHSDALMTDLRCFHTFQIYLQSQLRLLLLYFSLFTTCFGPYGPSSGEIQYHLHFLKYHQCYNVSVVL